MCVCILYSYEMIVNTNLKTSMKWAACAPFVKEFNFKWYLIQWLSFKYTSAVSDVIDRHKRFKTH